MTQNIALKQTVADLISRHLNSYRQQEQSHILAGLNVIADFQLNMATKSPAINLDEFQSHLSKINEKELRRRDEGVYYTPKDITEYIVANSFLNYVHKDNTQVYSTDYYISTIGGENANKIKSAKVYDPTCGTAEFLLSAFYLKLAITSYSDDLDLLNIVSTIYGNDIATESILLSKIRLFFAIYPLLKDATLSVDLANILNNNFTAFDFVLKSNFKPKFDIVIGNPPYVEYGKLPQKPSTKFGNTYADVLKNSIDSLKSNGIIGFVIPISFVATPRMKGIRDYSYSKLSKLFVLNFADRPDCLFDGVHQKLTILFGQKGKKKCTVYSSSYYHWYNDERKELLNNATIVPVRPFDTFIPKIGNRFEQSVFNKIIHTQGETLDSISSEMNGGDSLYLNMRGCFWMKAFSFNPGSNEYRRFYCPANLKSYLISLLNSNLFFLYWTIVSDCWHITGKELSEFRIPTNGIDFEAFGGLIENLERRLEETKKYIGSKQTAYEYKHRDCKREIDDIDTLLQPIFGLSDEEVEFLRNYKVRYRTSNG